jgi:peptidoglycan/xylan/chitin deacetylase (PgdA/CDA1 family)
MLNSMKMVLGTLCLGLLLLFEGLVLTPVASAAQGQGPLNTVPDSAGIETFSSPGSAAASAAQQAAKLISSPSTLAVNASILMYHHIAAPPSSLTPMDAQYFVAPATFDSQLYYLLANGYSVVPLRRLVDVLHGGQPLPSRSVAITIDDGWQDFWQNGLPLVKKYALPVTLFVIADADSHGYMSPDERWVLAHSGVDVEAHTMTHPYLSRVVPAQANSEIVNSKKTMEKELGQPVRLFAYPYGDFNTLVVSMVQAAGYDAAFAAGSASEEDTSSMFKLPRVEVSYYDTPDTFAKKVADYRWSRSHSTPLPIPPRSSPAVANSGLPAAAAPPISTGMDSSTSAFPPMVSDPGSGPEAL